MACIKNVQVSRCNTDPLILSTSGVSSCIGVVVELQNQIFIYHADIKQFNASATSSLTDACDFLLKIFNNLCRFDEYKNIKNTFIIGGWYNINYIRLRDNINIIRDYFGKKISMSSDDNFNSFINSIKLNLIGFNLPAKNPNGADKNDDEDDSPFDHIFDSTIIYDRSSMPHTFLVCQYSGVEDDMNTDKDESLLQVAYQFNQTSKSFEAFVTSNAPNSPYYSDLLNQVLFNVKDPLYIHHSLDNDTLKKIKDLLPRVKQTSLFGDN